MGSDNPIVYLHKDEFVTYPIVERMLESSPNLSEAWGRLIIYGDYHYGYPFYFLSMLTLLPLRIIQGTDFYNHTEVNILILRQIISVLPMILAAGVLTYVITRFRKLWASLFTFLFILTIPAVVRSNMHWWHPDALMMLAIAISFHFLDLDEYRLGKYFLLAAAACGLVSAIKLYGFFFFLTIPVYLLLAWRRRGMAFKKIILSSLLFVGIMLIVIVLSNPFLFYKGPRGDMLDIQSYKSVELSEGYTHEKSLYYSLGPEYWRWTLTTYYGDPNFIVLLFLLLGLAGVAIPDRDIYWLLLAWIVPVGIYLMWFVSPKPDHYLMPLLIPLYATVTTGVEIFTLGWTSDKRWARWAAYAGGAVYALILLAQCIFQISTDIHLYSAYFKLV
jgi:4-amino-4-deoxy-L-arabinose transferase-like glycosyltransferase